MICDYGCGKEAKHQFKNNKWCCSQTTNQCSNIRNKNRKSKLGDLNPSKKLEVRKKLSIAAKKRLDMFGDTNPAKRTVVRAKLKGKNNHKWKGGKGEYLHQEARNLFGTPCVITGMKKDVCGNQLNMHCVTGDHTIFEKWNWISISNKFHPRKIHDKLKENNIYLLKDNYFKKLKNQQEIKFMYINETIKIINKLKER